MSNYSSVGKEALAYCTSCKMDLRHTIVAMTGDRIAKVQCRTCKKDHTFRAPKGVTEPESEAQKHERAVKNSAKKEERATAGSSIELEWRKLMQTKAGAPSKTYSIRTQFVIGDKINHPNFGDGIVSKIIFPNKVEVFFSNDIKVLIHQPASI